jgi:hypothetical protein
LLLTGVDEARKLTIWMMANTGPGETIRVKYVLYARKSSHGLPTLHLFHHFFLFYPPLLLLCFRRQRTI